MFRVHNELEPLGHLVGWPAWTAKEETMEGSFKGWPRCDLCLGPVNPQFGVVSVDPDDWPAEWIWSHDHCLRRWLPDNTYIIEAERLDTLAKVLALTLCLAKEAWYQDTNWGETVERFYNVPGA